MASSIHLAEVDRVVAALELVDEPAGQEGHGLAEDGHALGGAMVRHVLQHGGLLPREGPGQPLLPARQEVDRETAGFLQDLADLTLW